MIGAIVGDIAGSRFEFKNIHTKNFDLMTGRCHITDDTIMALAVCKTLMDCNYNYENLEEVARNNLSSIGKMYPNCGYGSMFFRWVFDNKHKPYRSYGNGAAMRISPVTYVARDRRELIELSRRITSVSHNHIEGIKGAEALSLCIFMALNKSTKEEIRDLIEKRYYNLKPLIELQLTNKFDETCQVTVPQAITCFLESESFEDAIRNAVSIGGDSDTIASMTASIADAYYGVKQEIVDKALTYLDDSLLDIYNKFNIFINQN